MASGRRQGYYSEFGKKDRFHKPLLQQRGEPLFTIKGLWDLEICRHVVGPGACLAAKPGAFSQQERGYELKTRPAIRVSGPVGAYEATRPRTRVALNLTARARTRTSPADQVPDSTFVVNILSNTFGSFSFNQAELPNEHSHTRVTRGPGAGLDVCGPGPQAGTDSVPDSQAGTRCRTRRLCSFSFNQAELPNERLRVTRVTRGPGAGLDVGGVGADRVHDGSAGVAVHARLLVGERHLRRAVGWA